MVEVYRDMADAAIERQGTAGLIALWFRVLSDLVFSAVTEQLAETERRLAMWQESWGRAHFSAALVVAFMLAALATPADPASMLMAAVPIFGVYLAAIASKGLGPRGRSLAIVLAVVHAALWIVLVSAPAKLLAGVIPSPLTPHAAFLIFAALVIVPTVTTALIVGAVAVISRGRGGGTDLGPDEGTNLVA
jgi:hypothetical protein